MHSECQDSPITKLIKTVDRKYKFGMEILESIITNAIKQSAGYKFYKHKKEESKKGKAAEEVKEQHVSLVKSGRGKGYMCLGDQEKLKGHVIKDPDVQSLLDIRKGSKERKVESLRQEKQPVGGKALNTNEAKDDETDDSNNSNMDLSDDEPKGDDDVIGFRVFMYNKSTEPLKSTYLSPTVTSSSLEYIQNLLNEPFFSKAKKLMQEAKKNMRIINFKKEVAQKFKEYGQKLKALTSINVSEVIEKVVQAKVLTEIKKLLPTHVSKAVANYVKPRLNNFMREVMRNKQINLFTKLSTNTNDLLEMELKLKLLNHMQLNKSYETHDTHQQLYNTLYDSVTLNQEVLDAQDAESSFRKRTHDN
nr:hypothetical protein [Tanacetum cinerariifolium]